VVRLGGRGKGGQGEYSGEVVAERGDGSPAILNVNSTSTTSAKEVPDARSAELR